MTLNNFTSVLCNGILDLAADSFIQILDWETNAHYRMTPNGITLGGELISIPFYDLLDAEVKTIEFKGDHVEVTIST